MSNANRLVSIVAAAGAAFSVPALAAGDLKLGETMASTDLGRAYEAELVADAATHASLLADGDAPATSGWAKGKFFIGGGDNTLNIDGFIQARYLMNFRDNQPGNGDFTEGFQMRRTRIIFGGTIWSKALTYYIQSEFSRSTGDLGLLDAYGRYNFDNGVYVRWGQYKLPVLREESVADTLQLTVERSTVNAVFNQGRSQGVGVGYAGKQFRLMGEFSDGLNTFNTDFTSAAEADFALTGRGEWMFAGEDFKRFDDSTSWKGDAFAAMAGASIHYQSGGETNATVDRDIFLGTADVSIEGDGWNAFAEGVWRNTDVPGTSTDDFGFVVQGGFFVSDQAEVFARYDVVVPDVGDNFNTLTGGVNYYVSPHSHVAKFSADLLYYFDATTNTPILGQTNTGIGLLPSAEEGEVAVRLQMQLLF